METVLERERKLAAPSDFPLAEVGGVELPEVTLRSTYFDTPDYRLVQAGVTLRYRLVDSEDAGVWQLKLPTGADRSEIESQGERHVVPGELRELVRGVVRYRPLVPVATLLSHRSPVLVRRHGTVVAEVVRDRVAVAEAAKPGEPFVEVEVELRDEGTEDDLEKITRRLEKLGARPTAGTPKLVQALALRFPPEEADAGHPGSAVERLRQGLREQLAEIIRHDPGTRHGHDPEALHDMRVAVRRLRAFLRIAPPLLEEHLAEELRAELRWIGAALGAVRDLDVLIEHLGGQREALPRAEHVELAALQAMLSEDRNEARTVLLTALRDDRYLRLLDRLELATELEPADDGTKVSLPAIARAEHRKLAKAVRKLERDPSNAELHRIRIKAKRARYAAELSAGQPPRALRRYIDRATRLQDLLGAHQDAVVAERRIVNAGHAAKLPSTAVTAGRLAQVEVSRRAQARTAFPRAWRSLAKQARRAF